MILRTAKMGEQLSLASQPTATKRPSVQTKEEPPKRRARYAPRACDACRRRKGRCDGRWPCEYCDGRDIECCYSTAAIDARIGAADATILDGMRPVPTAVENWTAE